MSGNIFQKNRLTWITVFLCAILFNNNAVLLASTIAGELDREGRAWSYRNASILIERYADGTARIAGGGALEYEFHLPNTANGNITQLSLTWNGYNNYANGVNVYIRDPESGDWGDPIYNDTDETQGWRNPISIPIQYLENRANCTRVLWVKFENPGLLDIYFLNTVRTSFVYNDFTLEQSDLEACYSCALARLQTDLFVREIQEYDLWEESDYADGALFWIWASSVYQFAYHLSVIQPQSLVELGNLPGAIVGLYNDIFGYELFTALDIAIYKEYYGIFCNGPMPSSFKNLAENLCDKYWHVTQATGGYALTGDKTRHGVMEDLFEILNQEEVIYMDTNPHNYSFSQHADSWRYAWFISASHVVNPEKQKMGYQAADAGEIMEEFGNAWLNSFAAVTVTTNLGGINVLLNENPYSAPKVFHSIKGTTHTIGANSKVFHSGHDYHFTGWNDGGAQNHTIAPTSDVATFTANYAIDTGSLSVTIFPREAVIAGAQWKLSTESTWHASGDVLNDITTGPVTLEYKDIPEWAIPSNREVTVNNNQTANIADTYTITGDVNIDWSVNLKDFIILSQHWMEGCSAPGWCEGADLDQSGAATLDDLDIMTNVWLKGVDGIFRELKAWGKNDWGEGSLPENINCISVFAGGKWTLALKSDGSLAAWGWDEHHVISDLPAGNDFVAIHTGHAHGLALKSDGTVVAWGNDAHNQVSDLPAGLTDVIAISAGGYHSLALKSDGTVVGWGDGSNGRLDFSGNNYIAISAGGFHSLGLMQDGSLFACGENYQGQCDVPPGNDYVAISAGGHHSLALKSDGSIVAWGFNYYGQCDAPSGNDFIAIEAGSDHNLALKSDGSVVSWGRNDDGQCEAQAGITFVAISAGSAHSVGIVGD